MGDLCRGTLCWGSLVETLWRGPSGGGLLVGAFWWGPLVGTLWLGPPDLFLKLYNLLLQIENIHKLYWGCRLTRTRKLVLGAPAESLNRSCSFPSCIFVFCLSVLCATFK